MAAGAESPPQAARASAANSAAAASKFKRNFMIGDLSDEIVRITAILFLERPASERP